MRKLEEIGICPACECSISIFKTQNYKRFAKCQVCGFSYALPKRGTINNSALLCMRTKVPILIIDRKDQKAYFWADGPCFSCISYDKCDHIKELQAEFIELGVYGY
jgi:hypothetical protein